MERFEFLNNLASKYRNRRTLRKVIAVMSCLTLLLTMNGVKHEADTLERIPACGLEEHVHDETCQDETGAYICGLEAHVHTDACYQERPIWEELPDDEEDIAATGVESESEEVEVMLGEEAFAGEAQEILLAAAPSEESVFSLLGRDYITLSEMIEQLPFQMEEVVSVLEVIPEGEEDAPPALRIEQIEQDYIIIPQADFAEREVAIETDSDIIAIKLTDGAAVGPANDGETVPDDQAAAIDLVEGLEDNGDADAIEGDAGENADAPAEENADAPTEDTQDSAAQDEVQDTQDEVEDNEVEDNEAEDAQDVAEDSEAEDAQDVAEDSEAQDVAEDNEAEDAQDVAEDSEVEDGEAQADAEDGEAQDDAEDSEAEDAQDDAEDGEAQNVAEDSEADRAVARFSATVDLSGVEQYPLSLKALMAAATTDAAAHTEEGTDEAENAEARSDAEGEGSFDEAQEPFNGDMENDGADADGIEVAAVEAVPDEAAAQLGVPAVAEPLPFAEWAVDYDDALLSVRKDEADYAVDPIGDFDETVLSVYNGNIYTITLLNFEAEPLYPAQAFTGVTDYMVVNVAAPEGAFPAGTEMLVADVADDSIISGIADKAEERFIKVERVHAVDISFRDGEGNEIEPLIPISVVMSVRELAEEKEAVVVHVDDAGEAQVVADTAVVDMAAEAETAMDTPSAGGDAAEGTATGLEFNADAFSVYAVVVGEKLETKLLGADGETYHIEVTYTEDARIPAGATLDVTEVDGAAELARVEQDLPGNKRITLARFFDIKIMNDGEEVQPAADVQVKVWLEDSDSAETPAGEDEAPAEADEWTADAAQAGDDHAIITSDPAPAAMHFTTDGDEPIVEARHAGEEDDAVVFTAQGFSVWGIVYTVDFYYGNYEYHLDGEDEMLLSALFDALGIDADAARVTEASFTDHALLALEKLEGDWRLTSLMPFESHEKLTLVLDDGTVYEIAVDDAQITTRVLTADGETFIVTVTYGPEAQIPEGAKLRAREITSDEEEYGVLMEEAENALASRNAEADAEAVEEVEIDLDEAASEPLRKITEARFFDIGILADGEPVEPAAAVQVSIAYADPMRRQADDTMTVVHFAEAGTEILAPEVVENETGISEVIFETESFSRFATIQHNMSDSLSRGLIAYFSFDTYNDLQGVDADGKVCARARKVNTSPSTLGCIGYYLNGLNLTGNASGADDYYILEKSDGTPLLKDKITKELTVSYWVNITKAQNGWAFYIAPSEEPQVYKEEEYIGVVHNTIGTQAERYDIGQGKARGAGAAVGTPALEVGEHLWHHVVAVYGEDTIRLYIDGVKVSEVGNDVDISRLLQDESFFQVGKGNWGNGEYLSSRLDELGVFNYALSESEVQHLYKSYVPDSPVSAVKMSVSDVVELVRQHPDDDLKVVVYSRLPVYDDKGQKIDGKFEYYALQGDGTLLPIVDYGDTVGWRGTWPVTWKLVEHKEDGVLNGYFDFRNQKTNSYLAPQTGSSVGDDMLGLTMSGWVNGDYTSTIEGWNENIMSWVGMKLDTDRMTFVPATGEESAEFLFAVIDPPDMEKVRELELVDTVDNNLHGIKIQMFDYPEKIGEAVDAPYIDNKHNKDRSELLQLWLNNTEYLRGNENGGMVTPGLLAKRLDNEGYPVNAEAETSLKPLFDASRSDYHGKEANHLFIQRIYDETGYYEYDGGNNYAYLPNDSHDFQVYRQIGRPIGAVEGGGSSQYKGNFLPYNTLEGAPLVASATEVDGDGAYVSVDDPRYQKDLYHIAEPDYFFGMTLEASFYQPKGGMIDGETVMFEFNGDDDMWVFVDGVLILDIGGIHGPVRGTINFKTGEVYVQGDAGYTKTLGQLFREAGVFPDGTAWDDALASRYFKINPDGSYGAFKDYSAHTLKYFYLERGAGASNLRVRFNTPALKPGAFVVEKEMPEDVQYNYGDKVFAFVVAQKGKDEEGQEQDYYYFPPEGRPVVYEGTNEVAFDYEWYAKGNTQAIEDSRATDYGVSFGEQFYYIVYYLHPGEALVFPVVDSSVEYDVWEIAIDTGEIKEVDINDNPEPIYYMTGVEDGRPKGYVRSGYSTVKNRGRVVFNNVPEDNQVGSLRITKHSDSPVIDENATFSFNVKLEDNKTGQLVPYYKGKYYIVKPVNGVDHYFRYEGGKLVDNEDTPFAFVAGVSGSMSNIPVGYSALIPGLLAGTDFYVEERFNDMEGYTHIRTEVKENTADTQHIIDGALGTIIAGETTAVEANVNITNRPTGHIIAEKNWKSGDYVTAHGDVKVALFKIKKEAVLRDGQTVEKRTYHYVDGTVKSLSYDKTQKKYFAEYYVPEDVIDNYVIREVEVTYGDNGAIASVTPVLENGRITVSGETIKDETEKDETVKADNIYTVGYEKGVTKEYSYHVSLDDQSTQERTGHQRTDTITNTLPRFSARKTDLEGKALNGAAFELKRVKWDKDTMVDDATFKERTFTSSTKDETDGVIFKDLYLSAGTYLLTETRAPAGYNLLTKSICIVIEENLLTVGYSDGSNAADLHVTASTDSTDISFSIPNSPGVSLPSTGGPGTALYTLTGVLLILGAAFLLLRRRGC